MEYLPNNTHEVESYNKYLWLYYNTLLVVVSKIMLPNLPILQRK